ncbi:MAG: dihydroneopterin aldolase, partial [Rhodospirillales bacterium]
MTARHIKLVEPPRIADAKRAIRHVFIRDLMLPCSIGVHRYEKDAEQRVRINLDLAVSEAGQPIDDDIRNVICYE